MISQTLNQRKSKKSVVTWGPRGVFATIKLDFLSRASVCVAV